MIITFKLPSHSSAKKNCHQRIVMRSLPLRHVYLHRDVIMTCYKWDTVNSKDNTIGLQCNSNFHLIRSKTLPMNDFELTCQICIMVMLEQNKGLPDIQKQNESYNENVSICAKLQLSKGHCHCNMSPLWQLQKFLFAGALQQGLFFP